MLDFILIPYETTLLLRVKLRLIGNPPDGSMRCLHMCSFLQVTVLDVMHGFSSADATKVLVRDIKIGRNGFEPKYDFSISEKEDSQQK